MLFRQHFRGRHQRGLRARLDRAQHRQRRHQGLAGAHVALQKPQHPPVRGEIGVDLSQSPRLRQGGREAEPFQRPAAQIGLRRQRPPGARAHPPAHQAKRHLIREKFVIRQPRAQPRVRRAVLGHLHAAHCFPERGPVFASQAGRVLPFRQFGQQFHRLRDAGGELARPQPGGQRPDRLDRGDLPALGGRNDVIGMRDGHAVLEPFDLARDQQMGAGGHLRLAQETEEHQFGDPGPVAHDDPPGLARRGGPFVAHHLDRQRRHRARPRVADQRTGGAVQIGFRQMEQQIDHPLPPHGAGEQLHRRGTDAAQRCQGGEKRMQRNRVQGLTERLRRLYASQPGDGPVRGRRVRPDSPRVCPPKGFTTEGAEDHGRARRMSRGTSRGTRPARDIFRLRGSP